MISSKVSKLLIWIMISCCLTFTLWHNLNTISPSLRTSLVLRYPTLWVVHTYSLETSVNILLYSNQYSLTFVQKTIRHNLLCIPTHNKYKTTCYMQCSITSVVTPIAYYGSFVFKKTRYQHELCIISTNTNTIEQLLDHNNFIHHCCHFDKRSMPTVD